MELERRVEHNPNNDAGQGETGEAMRFPPAAKTDLIFALVTADIPPLAARVGVLMALHANQSTGQTYAGPHRLADQLGSNERTVRRMLRKHIEGRFFSADRGSSGGRSRKTYWFPIPQPASPWNETRAARCQKHGPDGALNTGHPAPRTKDITKDGTRDAKRSRRDQFNDPAKPSKPSAWDRPVHGSARGRSGNVPASLADLALEYFRMEGE
ncbi:MAG: hypothetical protein NXI12_02875 [Alphaproteobacteria bacterium]|nr:hypothetical protein [Alphaproteobacteria bacterium]